MKRLIAIAAATLLMLTSCAAPRRPNAVPDDKVYTLYRSSAVMEDARIHVATFDAAEGEAFNHENCEVARGLFEGQPGVEVHYWCEKGRYRK